ncbi:MAG TPA: HepT-like ribonuclease domain-containing protein [Conexibacter sp.]|nr:HepT-like ribonuclease domain-containing protein [Conexibacter sp.]
MAVHEIRPVDRRRWQNGIVRLLERFPREHAALEYAMATFGDAFELRSFKQAYDAEDDLAAYTRAQAVAHALGRVQNLMAELAEMGVQLASLAPHARGSSSERAFASLREAGAIDGALCRRLVRAQAARNRIEHTYLDLSAGEVHRAARLVREIAPQFLERYVDWIEPYLPR